MERILVIKLGALGDIILTMDAFHAIRAHHPDAHITLMTRRPFVSLASQMPWFDSVIADPSPKWHQVAKWLDVRRILRGGAFSRIYDLQANDRTGFYFKLMGKGVSEWCGTVKGCSHPRHDHRRDPVPAAERQLRFLESLGVCRAGSADTSWLTGDVGHFGLPEKYLMIIPGSAPQHPHKRWPSEYYAKLADHFHHEAGISCVAVGTDADREAISAIRAHADHVLDLAGKTDIGQLAELARRSLGVVGNDTGPIHIAAATGAPTLSLMSGRTDPARMTPHGPDVGWLRSDSLSDLVPEKVIPAVRLRST